MNNKTKKAFACVILLSLASCSTTKEATRWVNSTWTITQKNEYSIDFDSTKYTPKSTTLNWQTIAYRAFEKIVYVKNPVDTKYEVMNVFVPESYYSWATINGYNINNAPIFFPNQVWWYMPAEPSSVEGWMWWNWPWAKNWTWSENQVKPTWDTASAIQTALSKWYIIASAWARGRTTQNENWVYTWKAPAWIVDLKAAVAYLHYNDEKMPWDANKIISNWTSAWWAMSVLLWATWDNADYDNYLKEIWAAQASTSIFATSAYCPITDLEHADMAYEWQFLGINNYKKLEISQNTDFKMERKTVTWSLTNTQINLSKELASAYPDYINSLNLKDDEWNALTLDKDWNWSFKEYLKSFVISSAQKALDKWTDLSKVDYLTITNKKVTAINYDEYLKELWRMKVTPAFDWVDLSNWENTLFWTSNIDGKHFTEFSLENDNSSWTMADSSIIKMMNPLNYIWVNGINTTKNWRIRVWSKDADTSLWVALLVSNILKTKWYNIDFAYAWDKPHSWDYDLDELFTWIDNISK